MFRKRANRIVFSPNNEPKIKFLNFHPKKEIPLGRALKIARKIRPVGAPVVATFPENTFDNKLWKPKEVDAFAKEIRKSKASGVVFAFSFPCENGENRLYLVDKEVNYMPKRTLTSYDAGIFNFARSEIKDKEEEWDGRFVDSGNFHLGLNISDCLVEFRLCADIYNSMGITADYTIAISYMLKPWLPKIRVGENKVMNNDGETTYSFIAFTPRRRNGLSCVRSTDIEEYGLFGRPEKDEMDVFASEIEVIVI